MKCLVCGKEASVLQRDAEDADYWLNSYALCKKCFLKTIVVEDGSVETVRKIDILKLIKKEEEI